jgi:hypothetical protein
LRREAAPAVPAKRIVGATAALSVFVVQHAHAVVVPPPPSPEEGNASQFYVSDEEVYDSNIYRLPANFSTASENLPNAARSDFYNTSTLGGYGQASLGRQFFVVSAHADENRFSRNSALNNTSGDADGNWHWRVGPYLSGSLEGEYSHGLASFGETRVVGRDLVNSRRFFGSAYYQIGPKWSVVGQGESVRTDHSEASAAFNNFKSTLGIGGLQYSVGVDDYFRLVYKHFVAKYPQGILFQGGNLTSDFHEDFEQFLVKYVFTEKTSFEGNVGYLRHQYDNASHALYSGVDGRAWLTYRATDKVSMVARAWHEVNAYIVNESDYFVSKGLSLAPVWNVTDKASVSIVLSYEKQDYIVNSVSVILLGSRHDKLTGEQANFFYSPRDRWIVNLFVRHSQRSSSQPIGYDDQFAKVSLTYKFW